MKRILAAAIVIIMMGISLTAFIGTLGYHDRNIPTVLIILAVPIVAIAAMITGLSIVAFIIFAVNLTHYAVYGRWIDE